MRNFKKCISILCVACLIMTSGICVFAEEEAKTGPSESVFWKAEIAKDLDEAKFSEYSSSTYAKYTKAVKEEGEKPSVELEIKITKEKSLNYRKSLVKDGIDLCEYADGKLDKEKLGGLEFAVVKSESFGKKKTVYYGREAGPQMSLKVTVTGDQEDESVAKLLKTLEFTLPEGENKDAPYPWEGEPLVTKTGSVEVNGHKVTATQIVGDECLLAPDVFDNRVAVADDYVYVLSQQLLYIYKMDGDKMKISEKLELPASYTNMCRDDEGNVYVSSYNKKTRVYKDGKFVEELPVSAKVTVAGDGSYFLTYFMKAAEIKKTDPKTGDETLFELTGDDDLDGITALDLNSGKLFLSGNANKAVRVHVMDLDGRHLVTLSNEKGETLGSVSAASGTEFGYIALDANMRLVDFWDTDGKWLDKVDDTDLFGTSYPWMSGFCKIDEHTWYVSLSEERPDHSWDEVVVYRLTVE